MWIANAELVEPIAGLEPIAVRRSQLSYLVGASTRLVDIPQGEVANCQRFYPGSPGRADLQRFDRTVHTLGGIAREVMRQRERAKPQKVLRVERIEPKATL